MAGGAHDFTNDSTIVLDEDASLRFVQSAPTVVFAQGAEGPDPDAPTLVLSGNPAKAGSHEGGGSWPEARGSRHNPASAAFQAANPAKAGSHEGGGSWPEARGSRHNPASAAFQAANPAKAGSHDSGVRYVVVGTAGRGGMGVVHVARDVGLLREVALKELAPEADRPDARSRFVREVQVTAQLDHPHIVPVYSLEHSEGHRPAFAMKLIKGRTLAELIAEANARTSRGEPLDDAHALHTRLEHFLKVCDAVAYAHERGVVHRDLKPANVMVAAHNEVYVMDWGLCRVAAAGAAAGDLARGAEPVGDDSGATLCGTVVGTPRYMSPEQAQGLNEQLDARSDEYSLGAVLYELVTLRPPIAGKNALEILRLAAKGHREPIAHAQGESIAPELSAIIEKATARVPQDRYASTRELGDDVRRFMRGEAVRAKPDTAWQRWVRQLARHRQTAALLMLGFVVLSLLTVIGLLWRHERALAAEQFERDRVQAFVSDTARQGDVLQARLMEVRADVGALALAVGQATSFASPSPDPVPWLSEARPGDAGAFIAFNEGPRTDLEGLARRVMRADAAVKELVREVGHALGDRTPQPGEARHGGLVDLRIAFDSGLDYVFPPPTPGNVITDPRSQGWYRTGLSGDGATWAALDDDGDADVNDGRLALSAPVRDAAANPIGAVGLVVALDQILVNLVADCLVPTAADTVLLDGKGRVLAACERPGSILSTVSAAASHPALARVWAVQDAGAVEVDVNGEPLVAAFDRVHPIEWVLVRVARKAALLERPPS